MSALDAVRADYADALATLSPRQAWAVQVQREINAEVRTRMDRLSPAQLRALGGGAEITAYVAKVHEEVTADILAQQAKWSERAPAGVDFGNSASVRAYHESVYTAIEKVFPEHRVVETFMIGDTVYATVRGRHMLQFVVRANGDHIDKVFP